MSFVPDDYFNSCVDSVYAQITQNGKGRMAIEKAMRLVLVEALEEIHTRVSDIQYEHPTPVVSDLIQDLDAAIQHYE